MSTVHELKCWPAPFAAMRSGEKRFEFRKDDRNYQVGDILWNREWEPEKLNGIQRGDYTGREDRYRVTYKLAGRFGVPDGFCVLSVENCAPSPAISTSLPAARGVVITPEMEERAIKILRDSFLITPLEALAVPAVRDHCDKIQRETVRAALSAALSQGGGGEKWTKDVPTEQAHYWHWDGDEDSAPLLWCVLKSGSDGHCFTSANQHGVTHSIACSDWGGWWLRNVTPKTPEVQ